MNTPHSYEDTKKIIREGINKLPHLKENKRIQNILSIYINAEVAKEYFLHKGKEAFIRSALKVAITTNISKQEINDFNEDEQLELISLDDYLFRHIKNKTYKLSLEAVKKLGMNIEFVPDNLKTFELCQEAIKYSPEAIQFIKPHNLLKDDYINIITQAVCRQGTVIRFVPPEYQTNSLNEIAVKYNYSNLYIINNPTTELCINTIKKFSYAYLYIPKHMYNSNELMKAIIDEGWMHIIEYIKDKKE